MPRAAKSTSRYSVHPSVWMVQKWIEELPKKTGRSLQEWLDLVKSGPATEPEQIRWLKDAHGLGTNSAGWIVQRAAGKGKEDEDPDSYLQAAQRHVEVMFSGPKAGLRPLYDALLDLGLGLAGDVKACPCQTMVPLFRNHVIAQIKPSTKTRIDFGLALGDTKASGKLIDTGGFAKKDRITHRIPIAALDEIDAEVKRWLKIAYDRDG